jgi:hypothetical protein
MAQYQLAQANYGQWKQDITRELVQAFYDRVGPIIQSAVESGGWVWSNAGGFYQDPRSVAAFDHNSQIIFNMTVWETFEDLKRFVFNQVHGAMMQDRDQWIDRLPTQVSMMWWVKADERPTIAQAREKIALINSIGPSALAFDFKNYFGWEGVGE